MPPAPLPFPSVGLARALAGLGALVLVAGCASAAHHPHVVIVVIDTLRADRVGRQGDGRSLTPFLDSFAEQAAVYRNAYAPSPWTNPSVASLLTSRFQSQHGIVWFDTVLPESEETLPEILKRHGYATAGFVANPLLRAKHGFSQGFDILHTLGAKRIDGRPELYARAADVNQAALSWVERMGREQGDRPLFLYVHYMEPHYPFEPPARYLDQVLEGRPRPDVHALNHALMNQETSPIDPATLQSVRDAYAAEVMSVDAQLGRLFGALEAHGILRDAVVVVTADHGEELLEHGYVGHHQALYEESIRVPLIVRAPGMGGHAEVTTRVSLLDVAPTVLELTGIPRPASFEGYSLRPSPDPNAPARPAVVSELMRVKIVPYKSPHERAVIGDGRKLILDVDGSREFYDLSRDPLETHPDALNEADRAELLGRADQIRALAPEPARGETRELDPETLKQLEALGYKR